MSPRNQKFRAHNPTPVPAVVLPCLAVQEGRDPSPCTPGGSYEAIGEGGVSLLATQHPRTAQNVRISFLHFSLQLQNRSWDNSQAYKIATVKPTMEGDIQHIPFPLLFIWHLATT